MNLRCDAVVVREKRLEEQDRLLTLLTRDKGVITAYAKHAGRLKGGMAAATELLCYSRFELFQRGEKTFVDYAEGINPFFGLRQDLERLSLATYFCQLCCELVPPLDCGEGYLRLMLNSLHFLEKGIVPSLLLKPVFELRLLSMAGYMPNLIACSSCNGVTPECMWFFPNDGIVLCSGCRTGEESGAMPVPPGVFDAMRHIIYSDFDRLFAFKLPEQSAKILSNLCRAYLLAQVERVLPALNYYDTILGIQG